MSVLINDTAPDHPLAATFSRFAELLERRLTLKVPTSEDAVRYTFFTHSPMRYI
jgi:hypothetical protein